MTTLLWFAMGAGSLVIGMALSWLLSEMFRLWIMRRLSEPERAQLRAIEETVDDVAALARRREVSEAELRGVVRRVVEHSRNELGGARLLGRLRRVRVRGAPGVQHALLEAAERSLHERFTGHLRENRAV